MNSITQVIKLAFFILALTVGIASAVFLVKNSLNDPVAMHGDSTNDPKGVYEIYNDTIVTGEQVLTAQIVYGNYDQTEPNKGLCRIQTGKTRALFENNDGPEWSDYREVKQKDAASWVNPEGLFQANLVYGKDLPATQENEITRLNYANVLQWIEFRQIPPKETNKPDVTAALATPEPGIPEQEFIPTSPEVTHLAAQGTMNLWEETKIGDITPRKQGVTIKYGDEDVTDKVNWQDWDPTITNGSTKQEKSCTVKYGGKTVVVKVTFYKDLDVVVSTNDAVDGHPVRVTINHPEEAQNSFSTTDTDYNFRFTQSDETKQPELFKELCEKGIGSVPSKGGYVVANTISGGANTLSATVSASMKVGVAEPRYAAARADSETIKWAPFTVTYFNQTADEAYKNSGNYTDKMTGLIAGATDANAGTTSLIAAGDVITLKCNTAARYDYKGAGLLEKLLAAILNNQIFAQPEASEDYTAGTGTTTALALQAARATDAGEATVTFTDVVTGFKRTQEEKYCRIYSAFDFTIPSYNLDKDEAIVRDKEQAQQYPFTDLVVTDSKSLTTTNDKKLYVEKSKSVNDNGVVVNDWVYGTFSKAASLDAEETAAAENGVLNNYTLDCKTQWDGKHVSTNRQGRETFTAVYPDFGSRYTKEKIVFVWYPLTVEFTRPLDKDNEVQDSGYVGEPVIMTVSQNNDVTYTLDDGNETEELLVKSEAVNGEIKAKDCNFYKEFNGLSYDGVDVTRTFSSGSVAYTLNKAGTVTYSVNRARTGEKVEKGTSVFTDCNPGDLMNATSNGSDEALAVTDGENRVANGDSIYFNNSDNTGTMSVKNVTFDVLTWEGIDHEELEYAVTKSTIPTTATTVATCGNGTLKVEKGYEKLITLDKNGINFSFNNALSRDFYLMQAKARQFKFDFADEKKTAFAVAGGNSALYGVYRFDDNSSEIANDGIDILVSGFEGNTIKQGDKDTQFKWNYPDDINKDGIQNPVVLHSIYKTDYFVGGNCSKNLVFNYNGTSYASAPNPMFVKQMLGGKNSNGTDNTSGDTNPLTLYAKEGSIAGTDTSIVMVHPQFNNRTKTLKWKTFSDLTQEIDVVEMHDATIELGEGAENNLQLRNLGDNNYTDNKSRAYGVDKYTKELGRLQKASLSDKNITLVTKCSGNRVINYSVKNKVNGATYPITVNVHDFIAKPYLVLRDNYGYSWQIPERNDKGEIVKDKYIDSGNSKNTDVLVSNKQTSDGGKKVEHDVSVLAGDSIAIATNSTDFSKSESSATINVGTGKDKGTLKNYTTLMAKCDDTTKNVRYVLAERLVSKEADTKLSDGKVKFFSVSTKDGKIVDDDVTATVTVKDNAISSYYNNEKSNSEELVLEVRKPPNLWQITGQYNRSSTWCGGTACSQDSTWHSHMNSWCYANAKDPHGIIYNALGTKYTSGAKNAAGTYNTDGIAYLNVSDFGGSLSENILSGITGDSSYKTYRKVTFKSTAGYSPAGFVANYYHNTPQTTTTASMLTFLGDDVLCTHGYSGKYVYFRPDDLTDDESYALFTLSYSIDKGKTWYYVTHDNETKKATSSKFNYKNCIFSFSPETEKYAFRLDTVNSGKPSVDFPSKTTSDARKPAKIVVDSYVELANHKDTLGQQFNVFDSHGVKATADWNTICVNAEELGWMDEARVDIRLTFISPRELNRSYTFPITFYPKESLTDQTP